MRRPRRDEVVLPLADALPAEAHEHERIGGICTKLRTVKVISPPGGCQFFCCPLRLRNDAGAAGAERLFHRVAAGRCLAAGACAAAGCELAPARRRRARACAAAPMTANQNARWHGLPHPDATPRTACPATDVACHRHTIGDCRRYNARDALRLSQRNSRYDALRASELRRRPSEPCSPSAPRAAWRSPDTSASRSDTGSCRSSATRSARSTARSRCRRSNSRRRRIRGSASRRSSTP